MRSRLLANPTYQGHRPADVGQTEDELFHYARVFNGDGQNRPNQDNRYEFIGRVLVKPRLRSRLLR